ncbi:MAG TPA: alpha-galactosidase [Phycisphaerae bacterium]|nr:alpha-galactosidase [Phycisphaerae bacterium]HRR84371.1 alpha-galactosidase [Phycisphaerae bacterium]
MLMRAGIVAVAAMGLVDSRLAAQGFIDVNVKPAPDHEVRYTSGTTIYVEGLVEDRWVGRYWTPSGRINLPYQRWAEDAFELQVRDDPAPDAPLIPLSKGWRWVSATEAQGTNPSRRHFVVELSREAPPVTVRVHTMLDGTPVLTRWLEITNNGRKPLALMTVSPWAGRLWAQTNARLLPPHGIEHDYTLGYFTRQDQGFEGWLEWKPLPAGDTVIQSLLGQAFDAPFFIVRNEARGEYFVGHLAWSANWHMTFRCEQDGALHFGIGPSAGCAQRILGQDETVQTPAVHLGHIEGDLDSAVQAVHDHLRRSVLPAYPRERACLVQYSATGDQGYLANEFGDTAGMNESNILANIDLAAAIGADVFIVDAGWWDNPGDWVPSPARFPHGLEPIVDYAHKKGLLFGLYVEIERVNAWNVGNDIGTSKVAREHPDWVGPRAILDLTKPEVAAYVESELARLIDQYKLDLYRLDYNPLPTSEGPSATRHGFTEDNYWRYYEAFYGLFERIRAKYPNLILQQCAAGGARNDLGTMGRFHEHYLTDGLTMPKVLQNYSGQSLALPPEVFVIGLAEGAHGVNGSGHMDTYLRNVFTLSTPWLLLGVAPSLGELSPRQRERYAHYVNLYKTFIRPILPVCRMYHHAPVSATGGVTSSGWFAMEYTAPDRGKGWATIVRIGTSDTDTYLFKPRGLDRGKTYRATFDSTGETAIRDGMEWVRDGLPVRLEAMMSSELLLFEAQ